MAETLKVLIWGTALEGPCAFFRGYMFDKPLREMGVEQRHISSVQFRPKPGFTGTEEEALRQNALELDTSDLEWADVLVLRRYYNTAYKCATSVDNEFAVGACRFMTTDEGEAAKHEHGYRYQDNITRLLWPLIRDAWTGAIIYETDDNHWQIKDWNGYYSDVIVERDLIADMTRRADLVTVSTPALVPWYGKYNNNIRVIRNAIDPDLYVRDKPRGSYEKPRLVYYGSTARLRDYAGYFTDRGKHEGGYARWAVESQGDKITRVFLGTNEGTEHVVEQLFDEQIPYIKGIAAFSKALVETDGDIGIAPLGGDEFDRSKSELHWLEYAMADQAFIGERFNGSIGPYQVIEHGKDGLLARGRREWHDAVAQLVASKDLREELAGRAKERVLRDYDYRNRAAEWAAAYRWAAEHPRGAAIPVAA
jgi:glycosyltransferase involved in cell wall biosynthesis